MTSTTSESVGKSRPNRSLGMSIDFKPAVGKVPDKVAYARRGEKRRRNGEARRLELIDLVQRGEVRPSRFAYYMGVDRTSLLAWLNGKKLTTQAAIGAAKWALVLLGKPVPVHIKPPRRWRREPKV